MIDIKSFRNTYEHFSLEKIIKKRNRAIIEIQRYEKGKIPEKNYFIDHSPEIIYSCNQLYYA